MTKDEAAALLAATLHEIAPEADLGAIDPDLPLQESADIDSVDFLALVAAIHDRAGIEIRDRDFPKLTTLKLFVSYLMSAAPGGGPT
jgi:acyl carrier protein